ncbi:hypothetical protein [Bacteriovorax sp. Seq25_V]|uniref:hypothetical protein n=1 Tax=Bacteriovorax sp. Seq25_V TaxID=1201288 RepID=UPI000389F6D8|nr:hypothetical protein [Bacteriovorax sp. Seq25_V]EQC46782.1 hypothetical protein M900_2592 [Bacteriovorax sp. Seq25_V]
MKIIICLVLSSLIYADFTGEWSGEGYFYSTRREGKCTEVFFKLVETDKNFEIVTGGYNCSFMSAEYPNSVFERTGDKLFYEGDEVGYVNDNTLHLSYYDGLYQVDLIRDGNEIIFKEQWKDDSSSLVIKSSLSKL